MTNLLIICLSSVLHFATGARAVDILIAEMTVGAAHVAGEICQDMQPKRMVGRKAIRFMEMFS